MANNRYHKRRSWSNKNIRKRDEEISSRNGYPERDKTKIPFHEFALKYNVTWHAIYRFAERILKINTKEITNDKIEFIANTIIGSLPDKPNNLIDGAKYIIFDDFKAVINNGMVITIIKD